MRNLKLISIWRRKKSCGEYVNVHSHKYNELVYYVEGKGKTRLGEQDYFFDAGSFALIPPYAAHDERHNAEGCVMCMEVCGVLEWSQGLYRDEHGHILHLLKEILAETQNQYYGYKEMLELKLNELALQLTRNTQAAKQEKNFEYIMNYMQENYHEKILMSDCAKQLHISYDYFQHKFKKITGASPQRFLLIQRLQASEYMLIENRANCTEIAYRCGFSTAAQYSALFKREYGISPMQYRRQYAKDFS